MKDPAQRVSVGFRWYDPDTDLSNHPSLEIIIHHHKDNHSVERVLRELESAVREIRTHLQETNYDETREQGR